MSQNLKGYKGEGKKILEKNNIGIWDIVHIKTEKGEYEGIILPRSEYSAPQYIEIKLKNNYNIGIKASNIIELKKIGKQADTYKITEKTLPHKANLPRSKLFVTCGTVASRSAYTTGAVITSFTQVE